MEQKSQGTPAAGQPTKRRSLPKAGYQKGQETRERILDVALKAFGEAPYLAVTTRQISTAASVSLPTLQYYFADKEGLYRACAEAIVERYRRHTKGAGAKAAEALNEGCSAAIARVQLKALIAALGQILVGTIEAQGWAQFVARELRDPGPAFEILYGGFWQPGVDLTTRLIARILGVPESDATPRIQALLLISSLLAFQSGRSIALRTLQWPTIGPGELAMVLSCLEVQIDAIGKRS